jgi:hypothetical protein
MKFLMSEETRESYETCSWEENEKSETDLFVFREGMINRTDLKMGKL